MNGGAYSNFVRTNFIYAGSLTYGAGSFSFQRMYSSERLALGFMDPIGYFHEILLVR